MNILNKIISGLIPVFYLVIWFFFIFICKSLGFFEKLDINLFLTLSFLVMFFGMITKASSWIIGNQLFNISGNSKRHIEYSWHENWKNSDAQKTGFTIKIDHDDAKVIEKLMDKHAELQRKKK